MGISKGRSYLALVTRIVLIGFTWNPRLWQVKLYRRSRLNIQFGPFFAVL